MAGQRRTRIQTENRQKILSAALLVFARDGFRGATIDEIAQGAGMSKPNVLYYFARKESVYRALLEQLLETWLDPLRSLDAQGDPPAEIAAYIQRKIDMARAYPDAARLIACEILRGAPVLGDVLDDTLKPLIDEKAAVIRGWAKSGQISPVDPLHLIFAISATAQYSAFFDVEVSALLGDASEERFAGASDALTRLFLDGLRPR